MLRLLRSSTAGRFVAALVALSLSGAPRAALALAPEPEHRCQCAAHGERHRCACRICAEKARQARRGALAALPPCHRGLAEKALAAEEEQDRRGDDRPCVMPSCGGGDPSAPPRASSETFTLPLPAPLSRPGREEPLAARPARGAAECVVPDLPPPRA